MKDKSNSTMIYFDIIILKLNVSASLLLLRQISKYMVKQIQRPPKYMVKQIQRFVRYFTKKIAEALPR